MRAQGQVIEVMPRKKYRVRLQLGESRYKMETVYGSKRKAQSRLAALVAKRDAGALVASSKVNLEDFFEAWAIERLKGSSKR